MKTIACTSSHSATKILREPAAPSVSSRGSERGPTFIHHPRPQLACAVAPWPPVALPSTRGVAPHKALEPTLLARILTRPTSLRKVGEHPSRLRRVHGAERDEERRRSAVREVEAGGELGLAAREEGLHDCGGSSAACAGRPLETGPRCGRSEEADGRIQTLVVKARDLF